MDNGRIVNLERFWLPEGRTYSLTQSGWLTDPDVGGLWNPNPDAVATPALADSRCLILLGEPGMGKTSALRGGAALRPDLSDLVNMHVDLGLYGSEERLVSGVFENRVITEWQSETGALCITLDSFDEALSRIPTLDRILIHYLNIWDTAKLYLRIACRTADWPRNLDGALSDQFGDVAPHELLPLRRSDAALLLRTAGLEPDEVLQAIERARVVPLAARPLTLNLIQSSIGPDGSIPETGKDLYDRGLRGLVDELNLDRRRGIGSPGAVARRLKAAQRIAAISLFAGRPSVWTGPVAEAGTDALTLDDCLPYSDTGSPDITSDDVQETLRSGLFTGAGEGLLTWSHATFADFLAARWAIDEGLEHDQVQSLFVANDGRLYPRVRQVAAWLVAMKPNEFRDFVKSDPQAFLSAVDIPDETVREEVVGALLADAERGEIFDDFESEYSGLQHAGLVEQLSPALQRGQGEACRVAIRIARHCSLQGALPDLTTLALNEAADTRLRSSAAMAIHDLGTGAPSHDLVTLVGLHSTSAKGLEHRELEAAALMASWPHAISTEEVFRILSPAHPRNYYGLYSVFVDHFASGLEDADLELAAKWLLDDMSRLDDSRLSTLVKSIMRLCINNVDKDVARRLLLRVVMKRLDEYRPPLGGSDDDESLQIDDQQRRTILLLLLEQASEDQLQRAVLFPGGAEGGLVREEDLAWLIARYNESEGLTRTNAGRAAQHLVNPSLATHREVVLQLNDEDPAASLLGGWKNVLPLDSDEAVRSREQWQRYVALERRMLSRRQEEGRDEWINPRIATDIAQAASGDYEKFWYSARLVTVRPGTTAFMDEYQPDLTRHPRWDTLPPSTQRDFVTAAPIYLRNGKCRSELWFNLDKVSYPAQAAYRAFVLLLRLAPQSLDTLAPAVWREWAPVLIDWTATLNGASAEDKRRLLEIARQHAAAELHAYALAVIDHCIANDQQIFLRVEMEALDSEVIATELVDRLGRPMAAAARDTLLDFLIERHPGLLAPLLRSWLEPEQRKETPERAMDAAYRLLRGDARDSWPVLRSLLDKEPQLMEQALLRAAQAFDRRAPELDPQEVADLYLWLTERFPPEEDPDFEQVHVVGPREAVATWRDSLLGTLSRLGTQEAVSAVERIAQVRSDQPWLSRVVSEARRRLREHAWEPLTPEAIGQLAGSRRARLVRTDADLLAVTMRALDEIQARLQADTPASHLLWDTHAKRPKSEEEISDYLAIELEQRLNASGAVVNREVQVRRNKPTGLPERTDLRIEAMPPLGNDDPGRSLRVPGEVKGIWNEGLIDSLVDQLVQRYMLDYQIDHGIYIVAWFDPESWTSDDSRRRKSARHGDLETVRAALESLARKQDAMGKCVQVRVLDCSLKRRQL